MIKNEYGGCLPLEKIERINNPLRQYPHTTWNSGRSAIYAAVQDYGADLVWLPYYLCPSVKQFLEKCNIAIKEYHVNNHYEPILKKPLQQNEMILWTNWYGCMEHTLIEKIQEIFKKQVIMDYSQALFCQPEKESESYFVYSCRKFLGVPDGAYLVQQNLKEQERKVNFDCNGWDYLVQCKILQSNAVYTLYSRYEKKLGNQFQDMSELTKQYINGLDWALIKNRRKKNMEFLHSKLEKFNLLEVDFQSESCFMYPFMTEGENLHERLIQKHIFVPKWWKHMLQISELLQHEYKWAKQIVPLPIDQRYDKTDMEWIAEQVIGEIKK